MCQPRETRGAGGARVGEVSADHFDRTFIGFIHSELGEMSEGGAFKIKLEQKMLGVFFSPHRWKVKSRLESLSKCSISNINVFFSWGGGFLLIAK